MEATETVSPAARLEKRINAIKRAVSASYTWLKPFRRTHAELVARIAGDKYGETDFEMPVNMLARQAWTYVSTLTGSDPRVEVAPLTTPTLRGYADALAQMMQLRLMRMKYRAIEQTNLLNALTFGAGVVRVGLTEQGGYGGTSLGGLQTYIRAIQPEDYVLDAAAQCYQDRRFEGDRYRFSREMAQESGILDPDALSKLPAWTERMDETYRVGGMPPKDIDSADDLVELLDLYVPAGVLSREALVLTLPGDVLSDDRRERDGKALRIREYAGPTGGEYEMLAFHHVPGKAMPAAPAAFWLGLAEMVREMSVAMVDSEQRAKNLLIGPKSGQSNDAQTLRKAPMDGICELDNPDAWKPAQLGGASEQLLAHLQFMMGLASQEMGNAELAQGLPGGGRKTAREVQELSGRLNSRMGWISNGFYDHGDNVLRKLAEWEHSNPLLDETVMMPVGPYQFPIRVTADMAARANWQDVHLRIQRGSMTRRDEETDRRGLMELCANVIPLGVQLAMQTQGAFRFQPFIELAGKGLVDPAAIQAIVDSPALAQAAMLAEMRFPPGGESGPGGQVRRAGLPGTVGAPGNMETGSAGMAFDAAALPGQTMAGMAEGGY